MSRRSLFTAVAVCTAVLLAGIATAASSKSSPFTAKKAPKMLVGIYDEGPTFFDPPEFVFGHYAKLKPQILRVNMYWGGRSVAVADTKPVDATDPSDPKYKWDAYDRTVLYASANGIRVLFSIVGTPRWANGGKSFNAPPKNFNDLRDFARAAAERYSGTFIGPDGRTLPAVKFWAAWNEPNNPVFLRPQFVRKAGKWVFQGGIDYAKICTAIYDGVHSAVGLSGEKVGCGVTAPRGNNNPNSTRPSVSPLAFLRAVQAGGLKASKFDAWAHHPYYGVPSETPTTKPPAPGGAKPTAVTLGNFGDLVSELTKLYGAKRIWITEYAYQTNPPDKTFGVSYAKQAAYLTQAFAIARKNPRVDMMLWFGVRDEPVLSGWQGGLMTKDWKPKPSFDAFKKVPRG